MLIYLLKFSACLAIFMLFYKLLLEKENMHQLKRYYLLVAIFIALSIPLITFTTYVEPIAATITEFQLVPEFSIQREVVEVPTNYLPIILWSIYSLGVLLFGLKFIFNLSTIVSKIKRNPKHKTPHFTHVLLRDLITPHTFFSYIFLNKNKFETQQIPKEVFIHEEAHAKQKHSIDVLFIELLQIVFWFNPLIYLMKQSIKMNHEFLADEAVLKQGIEPSLYQQLLLTFSSNVTEPLPIAIGMANAINYSSIKKRFTVMKTHTSKQKIWLRSVLLLPLVALTLYGFSQTKEVVKETSASTMKNSEITSQENDYVIAEDLNINILENGNIVINNIETTPDNFKNELLRFNSNLSLQQREQLVHVMISSDSEKLTENSFKNLLHISNNLKEYGAGSVDFDDINKYINKDSVNILFTITPGNSSRKIVLGNTENSIEVTYPVLEISFNPDIFKLDGKATSISQLKEDFAKATNNKQSDLRIKTVGSINMSLINQIMAELKGNLQKIRLDEAAYIIGDATTSDSQENATPEEIEEYNKLAKQYNLQPEDKRVVKLNDLKRLETIYKKMSKEQKASAEPFPNCPPPPPPPTPAPEAPKMINGNDVPPPPPPPAPKPPLDHVIEMAKKGATFYYEGKSISSDEAIQLLKKNDELNISTKQVDSKEPKVYISKEPITVKNPKKQTGYIEQNSLPKPTEQNAINHLKVMNRHGAKFYYEENPISFDEAIKLLRKNDQLNISTTDADAKEPKVYISKESVVLSQQNKNKEQVMINGKASKEGVFTLTIEELKNATLTIEKGEIVRFMLKIPGFKTESISGKSLNSKAKSNLENIQVGTITQLFMIVDSDNSIHPPIRVTIK